MNYTNKYTKLSPFINMLNDVTLVPGVIIIQGNRTYGKKGNAFLYKFVPHDRSKKTLLVPFQIKGMGFNKCFKNRYVIVKQLNNSDGIISINIGDTDILDNFYEYSLFCKNLNHSIKNFTKHVSRITHNTQNTHNTHNMHNEPFFEQLNFEDRTSFNIISIDPLGCQDIDDAFGINVCDGKLILSIYISNVPFTIDRLGVWDYLLPPKNTPGDGESDRVSDKVCDASQKHNCRISSIYLPDKKITMLPTSLSDNICSLLKGKTSEALAMDITLSSEYKIEKIEYKLCLIKVKKNYDYDEIDKQLVFDQQYNDVCEAVKQLNVDRNYMKDINDSHDVIAFLMILMNNEVGKLFQSHKCGIFRKTTNFEVHKIDGIATTTATTTTTETETTPTETTTTATTTTTTELPKVVSSFLSNRLNGSGNYSMYEENVEHKTLGLSAYVHITSPIRRMVDLLNMVHLQTILGLYRFSSNNFFDSWYTQSNIEQINISSKNIRKLQNECNMLYIFSNDSTIINREHCGYVVDSFFGKNNKEKYSIYFDELNVLLNYSTEDVHIVGDKLIFKIIVFKDESTMRQKIRLQKR